MDPQVLNYGQSVFEGMKAQRSARGRIVLFRPEENAARMRAGVPLAAVLSSCWQHAGPGEHAMTIYLPCGLSFSFTYLNQLSVPQCVALRQLERFWMALEGVVLRQGYLFTYHMSKQARWGVCCYRRRRSVR